MLFTRMYLYATPPLYLEIVPQAKLQITNACHKSLIPFSQSHNKPYFVNPYLPILTACFKDFMEINLQVPLLHVPSSQLTHGSR